MFDLLEKNGKIDFNKCKAGKWCVVMDAPDTTLYKNVGSKLKKKFESSFLKGCKAIRYTNAIIFSIKHQSRGLS